MAFDNIEVQWAHGMGHYMMQWKDFYGPTWYNGEITVDCTWHGGKMACGRANIMVGR